MRTKAKKYAHVFVAVLLFILLFVIEIFKNSFLAIDEIYGELTYSILSRFIGGLACLIFMLEFSSKRMLSLKTSIRALLLFLPCMLIAVNNFPFVTFLSGGSYIASSPMHILTYALVCVCVGFFEEMAFRGCIFSAILQRRGKRPIDVFWSIVISSAVFGVIHLVNILAGASPAAVILQVGYSFLIGGMCSVILIKTANIWYCVLFHAVYNFAGGVVPECGGGVIWNTPEIILTAVVAVIVAVYVVCLLVGIKPDEVETLLNESKNAEQNNNELTIERSKNADLQ